MKTREVKSFDTGLKYRFNYQLIIFQICLIN